MFTRGSEVDRLTVIYSSTSGTLSSMAVIVTHFKVLGPGAERANKPSVTVKSEVSAAVEVIVFKSYE